MPASKPPALLLSPEAPFPLAGGGALRTASLLRYLEQHFQLDLVTFREQGQPDPERALREAHFTGHVTVIDLPLHSKSTSARIGRNLLRAARGAPSLLDRFSGFEPQIAAAIEGRSYQLAVIEHFWCAPYQPLLRQHGAKTIWLNLHNVESVLQERTAQTEPWPAPILFRRFASRYAALEREWFTRFDCVLAASTDDAQLVRAAAPQAKVTVYPNAIPERDAVSTPTREAHAIAFSGNLAYAPNISAVRWFARDVWPQLHRAQPGLEWRLIGRNPQAVEPWIDQSLNITATGPVDDAVAHLAQVKVVVAPLLSGSGTRLKILEAWAAQRAVVSTTLGAEGLEGRAGVHFEIADTADTMHTSIIRLLQNEHQREQLGRAGHKLLKDRYTWPAAWRELDRLRESDPLR